MFKVALTAGHYLGTPGKRCMKKLDPKETREWFLNDRICDKVEKKLTAYDGYKLLRTDDTTGKTDRSVEKRAAAANSFGADIYVSVHHNAGIKGGTGGGITAFTYLKVDDKTKKLQKLLYNKLIEKTGLKGNRSTPLATADFGECRETKMPAVLLECGFMDSATDVPIILSEDFAEKAAQAITEAIAEFGALKKKASQDKKEKTVSPNKSETEKSQKSLYYVQCGAFAEKGNAEKLVNQLKSAGFDAIIKKQ